MTLPEFLEKLEQTPRQWEQWGGGQIRLPGIRFGAACPISALTAHEAWNYSIAASQLRLDDGLVMQILYASDHRPTFWKFGAKRLRAKLLKACGLEAA